MTTRGLGTATGAVEYLLRCGPASHPFEAVAGRIAWEFAPGEGGEGMAAGFLASALLWRSLE